MSTQCVCHSIGGLCIIAKLCAGWYNFKAYGFEMLPKQRASYHWHETATAPINSCNQMVFRRIRGAFPCNRNSVISISNIYRSLNSSVDTVTCLLTERLRNGFQFSGRGNTFMFFTLTLVSGIIQPYIKRYLGVHSPVVKRRTRVIFASSPCSAELRNIWSYTPTSLRPHGVLINLTHGRFLGVTYTKFAF
jgi:hypothetical protein